MQVILTQDVKKIGTKGQVVEVSDGYGRNYLLPRKLAVEATAVNLNIAKTQAGAKAHKARQDADEAKLMAAQLDKVTVTVPVKLGEGGKIFGSVTGKDIATALKRENIDVDKKKISLKEEITGEGVYEATIKIHPGVTSTVMVKVVAAS